MGYFPSGLSLEAYETDHCSNCANYAQGKCPVFCMHLLWNYDQVDNEGIQKMLNFLIPREGIENMKCTMFRKVEEHDVSDQSWRPPMKVIK